MEILVKIFIKGDIAFCRKEKIGFNKIEAYKAVEQIKRLQNMGLKVVDVAKLSHEDVSYIIEDINRDINFCKIKGGEDPIFLGAIDQYEDIKNRILEARGHFYNKKNAYSIKKNII